MPHTLLEAIRSGEIRWSRIPQTRWLTLGAISVVPGERGCADIHQAASRGPRLWEAVLQAGGDRTRRDCSGVTPVEIGVQTGRDRLTAWLAV